MKDVRKKNKRVSTLFSNNRLPQTFLSLGLGLSSLFYLVHPTLAFAGDSKTNQDVAQSFVYQGRFFGPDGVTPLQDTVDLLIEVLDPSGNCLLYEEKQTNIDLTASAGLFSIRVGSPLGDIRRTSHDPGLTMAKVFGNFGNSTRTAGSALCQEGYIPGSGDPRKLRVILTPHSTGTAITMTPDQTVNSQTTAVVAQSLQGLSSSDFIQTGGDVAGQENVSLSTLKILTSGQDASSLHHHDSLYVKMAGSGQPTNLGNGVVYVPNQLGVGTSAPNSQLQINTGSPASKGAIIKGATSQTGNLLEFQNSAGNVTTFVDPTGNLVLSGSPTVDLGAATKNYVDLTVRGGLMKSGDTMTGRLTLFGDPVSNLDAVTKQYVDHQVYGNVISFNGRTGAISLTSSDVVSALSYTPLSRSGDAMTGFLSLSADPTASAHAATKNYVDTHVISNKAYVDAEVAATKNYVDASLAGKQNTGSFQPVGNYLTGLSGDIAASGPGNATATVSSVGGVSAPTIAIGVNAANSAASMNTAGTLIKRDASGNFSAGTLTASLIGNVTGNLVGNVTGNITGAASSNILKSGDSMSGLLILSGDPAADLGAATKQYVDNKIADGVNSFGGQMTSSDVTTALTYVPINRAGDLMTGFLSLSTDPTTSVHAATKNYVDLTASSGKDYTDSKIISERAYADAGLAGKQAAGNYLTGLIGDITASGPGSVAGTVNAVGGVSAAQIASGVTAANGAASANTAGMIIKRDPSGNFSAGVITANLSGNATSATTASNFSGSLSGDVTGTQSATSVTQVGGISAAAVASGISVVTAATYLNTSGSLIKRDANGNFSAGTLTASLIGNVTGNFSGNLTGNITGSASNNVLKAGDTMTGFLTLSAEPTTAAHAATKNYVDMSFSSAKSYTDSQVSGKQASGNYLTGLTGDLSASGPGNVLATISSVGGVSAASIATATNTTNAATSISTANTIVRRDASGNFTAGVITANLSGNATTATTATTATNATNALNFSGVLAGDVTGTQSVTVVAAVGGVSAASIASGFNATNTATASNTANTLVKRDASGNFSAGTLTASLIGNVVGNLTGSVTGAASNNILKAGDSMSGLLLLSGDPVVSSGAATKNYVDSKISSTAVSSFNGRSGSVVLNLADVTAGLAYAPVNRAGDSLTGFLLLNAAPTSNLHAATKNYVDLGLAGKQATGNYLSALTGDVTASGPAGGGSGATTIASVGGISAATIASGVTAANGAASANTFNSLVKRDASGNFTAGVITSSLLGNVTGNVTGFASLNLLRSGDTMTAPLVLSADPTVGSPAFQAATKNYVDSRVSGTVISFNSRVGAITLTSSDLISALTYTPINKSGDTMTGTLFLAADPTSSLAAATKNYVDSKLTGSGVTSFNTRSGAVTLTASDVTNALSVSGNIGIGTGASATQAALDVNGAIVSRAYNAGSATTIDWALANTQYTAANPPTTITFNNMKDGGNYTLICTSDIAGKFTFTATGLTFKWYVTNGNTDLNSDTMYMLTRYGNNVLVTWLTGYK